MGTISLQVDVPEVLAAIADLKEMLMSVQDKVNAEVTTFQADFDAMQAAQQAALAAEQELSNELQAVRDQLAAQGVAASVDLSGLDAVQTKFSGLVSALQGLSTPPAPQVAAPAPAPAPVAPGTGV